MRIYFTALNIVFGSLYLDEVTLDPRTVVSVLAAAELLQLDGLIEKCSEVMNSTINAEVNIIKIKFLSIHIDIFFHSTNRRQLNTTK